MKETISSSAPPKGLPVTEPSPEEKARKFLAEASQFQLGVLPTESRHPMTMKLSQLAKNDLREAIKIFNEVDKLAVNGVTAVLPQLDRLCADIRATLADGGRVFFSGCGATGRLAISLETLWREETKRQGRADLAERVCGFIAGADFALVRSIENFEDHPDFGVRQMNDLGFRDGDLMVAVTEGGETPFVIGTCEEAAARGHRAPWFIYCNPSALLCQTTERSRRVIQNPKINCLSIATGPMALSGSTRLQATTAQQLAVGAALFAALLPERTPASYVTEFADVLKTRDFTRLAPVIERESAVYAQKQFCVHRTSRYGITVLTDTTERTPTFSLLPFESPYDENREPSWTYLSIPDAATSSDAWMRVLGGRIPRPIEWEQYRALYGMERTLGYDFSGASLERRRRQLGAENVHVFSIEDRGNDVVFSIDGAEAALARPLSLLAEHLLVKCAMNMTSTLLMGRVGRFLGNVMIFVRPTNKKLVDRSIRYIRLLLEDEGLSPLTYDEVCVALFREFEGSRPDEPVVVRTFEKLKQLQMKRQA